MNYASTKPKAGVVNRPSRAKKIMRGVLRDWRLYVLLAPAVIYILLFSYQPMYGVQIAFRKFRPSKGIWGSQWVGMKYFIDFFEHPLFWKLIWNTMRISLYSMCTFPLPILLALLINELDSEKFKKTVQMITYAPHFLSTVVVCSMLTLFCSKDNGLFNHIIAFFGGERASLLENPALFTPLYVWSGVWQGIGWSSILYIAALSGVSPELIEAARIDGANEWNILTRIKLPLMSSIIGFVVMMGMIGCFQAFTEVDIMTQGGPNNSTLLMVNYIYNQAFGNAKMGRGAAASVLLFAVIFVLTLIQKIMKDRKEDQ